ncbi:glutaminyl-peptide cyclotransferase [Apodospora peruviana]|uniref:Peptide hydrolase n=1 Tax=Apodospora peruviana TaxID=516989 RepID=A0AAE0HVJ4_9PEZI|nr:glutaminyl-peptide cyclotransferase [Apodospora peruviana]
MEQLHRFSETIPPTRSSEAATQRRQRPRLRQSPLHFTLLLLSLILLFTTIPNGASAYKPLSDNFLRQIPAADDGDFDIHTGQLLAPILIPRVPGTEGQRQVQQHFVSFFRKNLPKWEIIWQNSTSTTPATGDRQIPFANLIFRRTPPWTKPGQSGLLTLVAHYDSKMKPEGFIGAIDSAAPCAVLMHAAKSIDGYLTQMHDEMVKLGEGGTPEMDMGVQILLLDGEEAFVDWTDTDSLYGARSLAQKWENTPYPAKSKYQNPLRQISLFVLLDLLGTANSVVPSYFLTTHWAYKAMAAVESRMRRLGLLQSKPTRGAFLPEADKTADRFYPVGMGDDHVPFMYRGAPVLHLIPSPFPMGIWHTLNDDGAHLDMPTVKDWAKIVTGFALEWLDMMEVEPEEAGTTKEKSGKAR